VEGGGRGGRGRVEGAFGEVACVGAGGDGSRMRVKEFAACRWDSM